MPEEQKIKQLVRLANTDLDGTKQTLYALRKIKGVGIMLANAVCRIAKVPVTQKIGLLTDEQVKQLDATLKEPKKYGIYRWLLNRRKDTETGEDKHLLGANLDFIKDIDIKQMKKIKCYKGIRHIQGQPVRGQRTRSNFRKNKGKVMGVKRTKVGKKAGK